jgi:pimeloyl-ACP methyl ester carboxylesterase
MSKRSRIKIAELTVDVAEPDRAVKGTVVLCHGAWVGGWSWQPLDDYLADAGYLCYSPTWRGHYDSKKVADLGNVSLFEYVEDALAVARSVGADVVIGHSMGGLIAQKVAESLDNLRAAAFLHPAPPRGVFVTASWGVVRAQLKYLGKLFGKKAVTPVEADYRFLILNNTPEPAATEFFGKICPDSGRALLEISLGKCAVDPNKVRCPTYVITGELDNILPPKVVRKIAARYGSEFISYPGRAHLSAFHEEGWEKVAGELAGWLDDKLEPSARP